MNLVFPLLLAFTVGFITSYFDCCSISVYCLLVCVCVCVCVFVCVLLLLFSECELTFTSLFAVDRPSVCRLSSVTLVHPTQAVVIFSNLSTVFGTLAIH